MPRGLLQISDPHFGTEQPAVVDGLLALAAARQPAIVVLSGDLTQRATARQFAAARGFIQQLLERLPGMRVLAVPGNHDIPLYALHERVFRPYRRWTEAMGAAREGEAEAPGWHVVALDTTRPWRHKHGQVSMAQAMAASRRLAAAQPGAVRVVVTHQPAAVPEATDPKDRLRGGDAALALWHATGVDLVLSGHIHLPYVLAVHGPPRPLWVVNAGTAVSHRVRGGVGNSVTEFLRLPGPARRCGLREWHWDGRRFEARPLVDLALAPA